MFHKLAEHAKLTQRMAARVGYDINGALQDGRLNDLQLQAMVKRCANCSHPQDCAASAPEDAEVPDYCQNRWHFSKSG